MRLDVWAIDLHNFIPLRPEQDVTEHLGEAFGRVFDLAVAGDAVEVGH